MSSYYNYTGADYFCTKSWRLGYGELKVERSMGTYLSRLRNISSIFPFSIFRHFQYFAAFTETLAFSLGRKVQLLWAPSCFSSD